MRVGDSAFDQAVIFAIDLLRQQARVAKQAEDASMTYRQLSEALGREGFVVPYFGALMTELLAEASRREHAEGRGLISALVAEQGVRGEPTYPAAGFYGFARKPPLNRSGDDMEIWLTELRRVFQENQHADPAEAPSNRAVTLDNLGAWLLKCNPQIWDFATLRQSGERVIDDWSVVPSYRVDLVAPGQRVLLWVTGRDSDDPEPGLWGSGIVTAPVQAGSVDEDDSLWLDAGQRSRSHRFMPINLVVWDDPVPRRILQRDVRLGGMEIFRQPQMGNPLWVSQVELGVLAEYVDLAVLPELLPDKGARFGDAEMRRAVELAAMQAVTEYYGGWVVRDVSRDCCGWDLTCESPRGKTEHVEVKGVSGATPSVLLTRNEARAASEDPDWCLAVVTSALTTPQIRIVDGPTALQASEPFVIRVNLS